MGDKGEMMPSIFKPNKFWIASAAIRLLAVLILSHYGFTDNQILGVALISVFVSVVDDMERIFND